MTKAVAERSSAVETMVNAAANGRALMGGTAAMRKAGKKYLPKFDAEDSDDYTARLAASWLHNGFRKTVKDMAGKVFDVPAEVKDAPTEVEEWVANIDLCGSDLSTFAVEVLKDGIAGSGISYILVDAPARPTDKPTSVADEQEQNLRPFLVHLTVEDVLGWKTEVIANVTTLSQFRIMESAKEDDPDDEFGQITIPQVRVLTRTEGGVRVDIYRKSDNTKDEWVLVPELSGGMTGLPDITVVPFYANRTGFFTGRPLLDDLADVNIAHWQIQSDYQNALHFGLIPILFAKGFGDKDDIVISSRTAVKIDNDEADLKFVETEGRAYEAANKALKDQEFQMETHGLQLLVARQGAQSATGEALDAAKETSTLSMIADALQDAFETAIGYMAQYASLSDTEVEVVINKDFGVAMLNVQQLQLMLTAVQTGNLSQEKFWAELSTVLKTGPINAEEESAQIEDEGGSLVDDFDEDEDDEDEDE